MIEVTPETMLALNSLAVTADDTTEALRETAWAAEQDYIAYTVTKQTTIRESSSEARGRKVGEVAEKAREQIGGRFDGPILRFGKEHSRLTGDVNRLRLSQWDVAEANRAADKFFDLIGRVDATDTVEITGQDGKKELVNKRSKMATDVLIAAAERDDRPLLFGVFTYPLADQFGVSPELLDTVARRHMEVREPEKVKRIDELAAAIDMLQFNRAKALQMIGYAPVAEPVPY